MIDQFRSQIQERLNQLLAEADKLRRALAALGGGKRSTPAQPAARSTRSAAKGRGRPRSTSADSAATGEAPVEAAPAGRSSAGASSASGKGRTRGRSTAPQSRSRAAQGQTRSAVLAALSDGEAMTASAVADATGLGRASVSTTLSKLAKTGEVAKADRGYRRAESPSVSYDEQPQEG